MIISEIRNEKREQKLIVACNIFNNNDMKTVSVPGMDYTLNIDFEKLTMAYVENILTRVHVFDEKIVLVLNVESKCTDVSKIGKKIFKFTNSKCVEKLIDGSSFTAYHDTIVKDITNEF